MEFTLSSRTRGLLIQIGITTIRLEDKRLRLGDRLVDSPRLQRIYQPILLLCINKLGAQKPKNWQMGDKNTNFSDCYLFIF